MPGPVQVDVTAAVNQLASEIGVKVGPRLLDAAIGAINDTAAAVKAAQEHEMRDGCEGKVAWVREAASGFEVGERDDSEGVQPTMPIERCGCEACRR